MGLRVGGDRLAEADRTEDIDAIDICTPNNTHAEIAIAAARAGKAVLCEKPLAMNLVEGQKMVDEVEKAGVPNTVWYNYRRVPAVTLAKNLIDQGRLGRIYHYRATSSRTGRSPPIFPREAPDSGGLTSPRPARASPATSWPIASTPPSGSTVRSTPSPP